MSSKVIFGSIDGKEVKVPIIVDYDESGVTTSPEEIERRTISHIRSRAQMNKIGKALPYLTSFIWAYVILKILGVL